MTNNEPIRMSNEEASAFLKQKQQQQQAAIATKVAEAKRRAASEGKEPFDLDRFEQLYTDPNADYQQLIPRDERVRLNEEQYYIGRGRRTKTLQEFADIMRYHDDHDWT